VSYQFKPVERDQACLLPPSLSEWLPAGDLAYFLVDVVESLDLSEIYAYYTHKSDGAAKAASGQPAFHPKMMVALLLYAYANGTPSSRRIARKCERDVGYRVVCANQQPDFRTISEFRRIHLRALKRLFVQVLHLAREAGLRIRKAKQALEDAAREKAQAEGKLDEQGEPKPPARGRAPAVPPGTPKPKDQYNFTDPESHIMKMGDGSFDQAYNCQAAVDSQNQIIVAEDATAAPNDKEQVRPTIEQTRKNLDAVPGKLSGDSGFYSEGNVSYLRKAGIDDYLCPDRLKHGEERPAARGRIPKGMAFIDRVRRKLWTKKGRATYALRKQIVEPVFGQIKHGRGLRQFLLRGIEKVRGEWSLWCTTHNLLKMWVAQV